jgi:hypothetical protein
MDTELYETLRRALRESLALARNSGQILAGLALCTDDELVTLYCAVTTAAEVAGFDADFLYTPVDWPTEWRDGDMLRASELLRERAESRDIEEHVDSAFSLLVQVLAELRAEGEIAPDTYLTVLSTDPIPYLEALEQGSIERLNNPDIINGRRAFLARWA